MYLAKKYFKISIVFTVNKLNSYLKFFESKSFWGISDAHFETIQRFDRNLVISTNYKKSTVILVTKSLSMPPLTLDLNTQIT